jgi:hypothetical protein
MLETVFILFVITSEGQFLPSKHSFNTLAQCQTALIVLDKALTITKPDLKFRTLCIEAYPNTDLTGEYDAI